MRTLATLAAAALTVAACATNSTAVDGTPPVRHIETSQLPEQPAHEPHAPLDPSPGPVDHGDPESVAVALIVEGLADQGLQVVDLGVEGLPAQRGVVTVRVVATHQADAAAMSHTSVYEIDLARDPAGSWRPVGFRQAQ